VAADKRTAASQTTRVGTEKRIQVVLPNPASARSLAHQQSPEAPQWRIEVARPRSLADPGPSLRSLTPPVRLGHRGSRVNWVWQTCGKQPTAKPFHMHTLLPLSLVVMVWPLRREYMRTAPPPHTHTFASSNGLVLLSFHHLTLTSASFRVLSRSLKHTHFPHPPSTFFSTTFTSPSPSFPPVLCTPWPTRLLPQTCLAFYSTLPLLHCLRLDVSTQNKAATQCVRLLYPRLSLHSPSPTLALCGLFTSMSHLAPCQYPGGSLYPSLLPYKAPPFLPLHRFTRPFVHSRAVTDLRSATLPPTFILSHTNPDTI